MNAVDRARKALLGYDRWWNDGGSTSNRPEHADWAAIVRDLLAAGELTAAEREAVDCVRTSARTGYAVNGGPLVRIIDRLAPASAPAIKPGDRVRWWRGEDSGTGTYVGKSVLEPKRHNIRVGPGGDAWGFCADRVEPLEGGTP